jgi:pimeloyl-ACP methyl ester carboxylesterase
MSEREIRYCTAEDGVSIAYSVEGDDDLPPLVWVPGWVSHLELDGQARDGFGLTEILRSVRFISFDKRGTGLSQRDVEDFSLEAHIKDVRAVVDDLGLDAFALAGWSEGGPLALGFAARHPDRVSKLTIVGSFANGSEVCGGREMGDALQAAVKAEWGIGSQFLADMFVAEDSFVSPRDFASYQRLAANPVQADGALRSVRALDVRPLLAQIEAPTLVIHTRDDRIISMKLGQEIAAGIRGARFTSFPGAHIPSREVWQQVHRAMLEFVTGETQRATGATAATAAVQVSGTAIILFTDIADSTALTERLGDVRFRDASRALDAGLRAAIREAGGEAIEGKLLGDGVLATFGSAAQAIDGARRCLALSAASELGLHIGLHAGDVIREDNADGRRDVFGGAVNIASRICGLSAPGEILVSDVVRGMGRSSAGVEFEDRGEQEMKGVGEAVRVYAVRAGGEG